MNTTVQNKVRLAPIGGAIVALIVVLCTVMQVTAQDTPSKRLGENGESLRLDSMVLYWHHDSAAVQRIAYDYNRKGYQVRRFRTWPGDKDYNLTQKVQYDKAGLLKSYVTILKDITEYRYSHHYDKSGLLTRVSCEVHGDKQYAEDTLYTYDSAGRITLRTVCERDSGKWSTDQTIETRYDAQGKKCMEIKTDYRNGLPRTASADTTRFSYNDKGLFVRMDYRSSKVEYEYDSSGERIRETVSLQRGGQWEPTCKVEYSFDPTLLISYAKFYDWDGTGTWSWLSTEVGYYSRGIVRGVIPTEDETKSRLWYSPH